jgi:hypothetical protein
MKLATDHRTDAIAKHVDAWLPRRRLVQGMGGLALGALGLATVDRAAEAERCDKRCKNPCKDRRKPHGSDRQCRKDCQQRCK